MFCLDDTGITYVIQVEKEFKVLYKNSLYDKFWASAVFAEDTIILRGVDSLYCISKTND